MASGGLRTQRTNTAAKPVSGPGSLSQRTDMDPMPNGQQPTPASLSVKVPPTAQPMTKLFDPTARPDEPVTAGASVGPGYTPPKEPIQGRYAMVSKYMPQFQELARTEDVPQSFKIFMRYVEAANRMGD